MFEIKKVKVRPESSPFFQFSKKSTLIRIGLFLMISLIISGMFFQLVSAKRIIHSQQLSEEYKEVMIDGSDIFIIIPSSPTHLERRNAIRHTWKKDLHANMNLTFFIGTKGLSRNNTWSLSLEEAVSKDIIFLTDFEEKYSRLTEKMLTIYSFIAKKYKGINWIFKTDSDVWLNPSLLQTSLSIPSSKTALGKEFINAPVLTKGIYANLKYRGSKYPTYFSGAGYAISFDIVTWIAKQYDLNWLEPLPNEDAAFGVWMAGTNIKMISIDKSISDRKSNKVWNGTLSRCTKDTMLIHYLTPKSIYKAHTNFKKCHNPCKCSNK